MVYRGMTCWVRAIEVPCWVPDFEEDGEEGYDVNDRSHEDDMHEGVSENHKDVEGESDREEVPETNFEEVPDKSIFEGNSVRQNDVHSEDPFGIYEVLNKKWDGKNIDDKHKDSLKYPPRKMEYAWDNMFMSEWRFLSDHRPIIMREARYDYGPIPFKIFHYLFELDGFDKLVEHTWLEANVNDQNSYSKFMKKLKYLKEKIRIWARIHKESLNSRKSIHKAELAELDGVINKGEGSDADGHRRRESIEGNENSKYYLGVLNKKRGRLTIRGVLVDGIWMESPHLVKHEFFEHFKNRFEKPNKSRILLERDFIKRISLEQNDDLEREVSNEAIKRAVWDCGIDKAPEPNGFTFGFYRRYWDIIGNDVVDAVKWFFLHGEILKGGNSSFITLILKVPNANMVKDFRPISLVESVYKVIAKVLENHLLTVLDDIVDEIQSAFVMDRQILGGPFILNEIVHWCKNKKKQSMIFTVDFEKAYDSVIWDLIDDILRRFGFGEKWSIFMGQWSQCNIDTIIRVLDVFYRASGLRINMNKSNLMGMHTWLSKWKLRTLSIEGRLTLIKSVLGTIPIYHISIFKVLMKVIQNMESIRARFFNGADVNSKKKSWVRWKSVLAAKDVGGLGVSSLFALNRTLMFKWVWRLFSQKNSLWVRMVKALHGEDGKISKKVQPRYPSTWLNIINDIESLKLHGIYLVSFITLKLGNGVNSSFWDVAWCGDITFKILVPRLYVLESMKNIEVSSKLSHEGLEFSFRRNPKGGVEQAQFERLKNGRRKLIDSAIILKGISKTRWIKEVPIKINVNAWKVIHGYLPTKFNISRRDIEIESILCPMCECSAESSRHLFFSCKMISDVMRKITRWWDLEYMEINSFEDWCQWISSIRLPVKQKHVFEGICYIVWWYTWNWRNLKIFGQEDPSMVNVYDEVVYRSFYWIRFRCKAKFCFINWLKNPNLLLLYVLASC
nr:RNA-directed DNA polymerase, eukaryota [Tanacetum cinerariifolium]